MSAVTPTQGARASARPSHDPFRIRDRYAENFGPSAYLGLRPAPASRAMSVVDIILEDHARGLSIAATAQRLGYVFSADRIAQLLAEHTPKPAAATAPSDHDRAVAREVARITAETEARRQVAAAEPQPQVLVRCRAELAALPQPSPLWEGWLYASSPALLAAPGGVGKSALALGLACAVTHGIPYLGHETRRGRVLYIAGEGEHALDRRLRAWEVANGIPEGSTEIDVIYGNQLTAATLRQISTIVRAGRHSLVIADTFSSLTNLESENDNSAVSRFIRAWQRAILDANPTATPVLVHHVTATIDAQGRRRQKSRGASAFRDDHDTVIMLDGTADAFRITTEQSAAGKQKDAEPRSLDGLALRKVGPHVVVVQESEQEQAARESRVRRLVELMVPGNGYSSTELQELWGLNSKGQFQAIRTEAVDLGWIVKGDGHQGRYVRVG